MSLVQGKAKILVVEDDQHTSEAVCFLLGKKGFGVLTAADGAEGWKAFQSHRPDLVITDITMPNVDGLELLGMIRKHDADLEEPDTPVLILTAKGADEDILEGYKQRADYYVTKPFTEAELFKGIVLLLEHLDAERKKKQKMDRTSRISLKDFQKGQPKYGES